MPYRIRRHICRTGDRQRLVAALATILLAACGTPDTPEEQVRAVIAAGEAAAEERDLSGLMGLVSEKYADEQGRGRDELQRYVHAYLIANQSIRLLTHVDHVEFPYRDVARVQMTLGSLARDADEETAFDLAADVEHLTLELQLDDGDWKVTRARRVGAR